MKPRETVLSWQSAGPRGGGHTVSGGQGWAADRS